MARRKSILSANQKKTIRNAQRRLRNAPAFMKRIAEHEGLSRLSTKGNQNEVMATLRKAEKINAMPEMTKRGFKKWQKGIAEDTRLDISTIDYALSQIDTEKMDFIKNSRLRYGSNPQLDYVLDNAVEIRNNIFNVLEDLTEALQDIVDIVDIF